MNQAGGWRPALGAEGLLEAATGLNRAQLANGGVTSCSVRGRFCEIHLAFTVCGTVEKRSVLEAATFAYILAMG